jgi:transcriptional regulator with GAF, ATPase, and Fis domain
VQTGLAAQLEMQAIYDLVGETIRETFKAQAVGIGIIERDSGLLRIPYVIERGRRIVVEGLQPPYDSGFAGTWGKPASPCSSTPVWPSAWRNSVKSRGAAETPKSVIWVPLRLQGHSLGAITVQNLDTENAFTEADVRLLETLAGSMAVALENARLFNETQQALARQTATAEVLRVISRSVSDTAPVFDKILDSCQRLFSSDELGIFLVTDDGERVDTRQWRGSASETLRRNGPMRLEGSFTGQAIRERRTLQVDDAQSLAATHESARRAIESVGNYSAIYSPMIWEGRGIGAICVVRQPPRPFTERRRCSAPSPTRL